MSLVAIDPAKLLELARAAKPAALQCRLADGVYYPTSFGYLTYSRHFDAIVVEPNSFLPHATWCGGRYPALDRLASALNLAGLDYMIIGKA